jgi:hypothetical protein
MVDMGRSSHLHDKPTKPELIAGFGGAELVKHLKGKVELRGGSVEDLWRRIGELRDQ